MSEQHACSCVEGGGVGSVTVNFDPKDPWIAKLTTHDKWRESTPTHQTGDRIPEEGDWPCGSVVCPDDARVRLKGEKCSACRERIEKKFERADRRRHKKSADNDRLYEATPWVKMGEDETTAKKIERAARKEKRMLEAGMKPEEVYGDRL